MFIGETKYFLFLSLMCEFNGQEKNLKFVNEMKYF